MVSAHGKHDDDDDGDDDDHHDDDDDDDGVKNGTDDGEDNYGDCNEMLLIGDENNGGVMDGRRW